MISEPELVGDDGELPPTADVVAADHTTARTRRPWLRGALSGALGASALWAAGLALFGGADAPDTRGYVLPADLCSVTEAQHLVAAVGKRDVLHHAQRKDDSLDRSWCDLEFAGRHTQGRLSVSVELHKKTDPAAEFEALSIQGDWSPPFEPVKKVSGLGDEAYLGYAAYGDAASLSVRDGATVVRLWLYVSRYDEKPFDFEAVRQPLIEDTEQLMEKLKKDR